jgi:DNA polymerase
MYTSKSREKIEQMNMITSEARSCLACDLGEHRKNVVVGSGSLDAEIALVGEAPGRKEDESGLPFVGSAGKLLDNLLGSAGLSRGEIFIGNILKCRPPGNRRPKKSEVDSCEGYLMRQLEVIRPKVVAPMGNSALSYFQSRYGLGEEVIGDAHGRVFEVMASWGPVKLVPMYHPAAAIYRRHLMGELEEDMKKLTGL